MILRPFELRGPRGGIIRGDLYQREGPPPRSAVVVVHGFKGFRRWGFFPHVCAQLTLQGYFVVSFDFSHNGIGSDLETLSELDAFSRNTMTREVDELNRVLEVVSAGELTSGSPGRLGLLGHSRGGADAILSSHETGLVDALVTWGAIDHLERWGTEIVREWEKTGVLYVVDQRTGQRLPLALEVLEDYRVNRERLDLHAAAAALTPPWLIVHGEEDLTVPVEEGRRLAERSREARLLTL